MAKQVAMHAKVEIRGQAGWVDISDLVAGWVFTAGVGELYMLDLRLTNIPDRMSIISPPRPGGLGKARVPVADVVTVDGVNLSNHTCVWRVEAAVGEIEILVLSLQCDSDVLRINGAHPWDELRPHETETKEITK